MKQRFQHIILLIILALAWSSSVLAWGETTSYVVSPQGDSEIQLEDRWSSKTDKEYSWDGPGKTLIFEHKTQWSALGEVEVYVTDVDGKETKKDGFGNNSSWTSHTIELDQNIRKIRFHATSTERKWIRRVEVTRATTLSVSSSSPALSFGDVHRGNNKTIKAKVDYNNTTYNQQLTGTNLPTGYSVTATTMGATGTNKEIPVIFTASSSTALGANNGNVTLTMNGKSVTIAATANVVTTYYGQATAQASAGGSAYVSFTSYDAATSTSATTNTANTTAPNASKTAYYKATVNTGYRFLGWIKGTGSYNASNVVSTNLTYNPSVTYSSETSGSPTVTTYKAWFAPLFYFSASATSSNESLGTASASVATEIQGNPGETTKKATATFEARKANGCTFNGWYEEQDYSGSPVSMSTTYTCDLTDNNVSSTTPVSKTLYAWFKKNPNLQWADPSLDLNLVKGTTGSSAATAVDDSITIIYTSSNTDAVTIDADGTIHALQEGQSTIKAKVASTFTYNADSLSRVFAVADKQQAAFAPDWWTDENKPENTDIKVGATTRIALTNVATDETFRVTTKHGTDTISWERDGNDIVIHAVAEGRDTITLVQDERTTVYGESATYYIKVSKYANPFAVAAESKAMKVGDSWTNVITNRGNRNTPQVSYSVTGIATYNAANNSITANAEGSTVITFTQATTADTLAAKKTINVSVTKVANTLSITLSSLKVSAEVGDPIAVSISGRNNEVTDIVATIATDSISPIKDASYGVISYANGVITARNAGRARITFSQAATTKYTDYESEEYEVTVSKKANSITITNLGGSTATNIKLKYNATAALTYTSTNTDTSPTVTRVSGSYTTYSNGTITAGTAAGTDIYEITQAETYKYKAGYASFTIRVNNTDVADGYVLYEEAEEKHTPLTTEGTYFNEYTLTGPGDILSFKAHNSNFIWDGVTKLEVQCYVNGEWQTGENAAKYIENLSTSYGNDITCTIPDGTTKIRFFLRVGSTLEHCIKDIKVTRKTYVDASASTTNLGTCYTDQTLSTTFTVNYSSTNGGDIIISSNNNLFVPSISSISVESEKTATSSSGTTYICGVDGTKSFTVTYTPDPNILGPDSATIKIEDLFNTQLIKLYATSKKYTTSIARGSNTATETTVEGNITNAFVFSGTTTATPSDDEDDDFYYEISHTQTSAVNNGTGVISYNPATNTITGLNQGTARLTIVQKKTRLYNETIHTFDFTVSKLANNVTIALNKTTLNVDDSATVQLTNDDSKGALSAEFTNISYANEDQNRDGGLLSFTVGTKTLKGVNAGTCKVTITQAETYMYESKSAEFNVTINKLAQTLTWDDADLETGMQIGTTLSGNTATSDVGLTPVTYSSSSAAITVNATTGELTAVSVNSNVTITASQAGNYKYLPATLTRVFSVFNKQVPTFVTDAHFTGTNGQVEQTCTAIITVTGVSDEDDFSITNGDNTIINVVRDGETITITGLKLGSTTLTLAQQGNENFIAKTQTYNITVFWPDDFLTMSPTDVPTYTPGNFRKVFFNREFSAAGYYSLALPFSTTVATLTGRDANANDWVAQLETVTYSQADGYTLHFNKVTGGVITANEPYILHLGATVTNPTWTNVEVEEAEETTVEAKAGYGNNVGAAGIFSDWSMTSNFNPEMSMNGRYGVVNGAGALKKGGSTATLKAFSAYIEGPASSAGVKVQSAFTDEWGVTTYIKGLPDDGAESEACGDELYDLSGRRIDSHQQPTRGIYVRGGRRVVVK